MCVLSVFIAVIDGVHGRPAEGISVSIESQHSDPHQGVESGLTDSDGHFWFSLPSEGAGNRNFSIWLDVDAYFAGLGWVARYKHVSALVRVPESDDELRIVMLITPAAYTTWFPH